MSGATGVSVKGLYYVMVCVWGTAGVSVCYGVVLFQLMHRQLLYENDNKIVCWLRVRPLLGQLALQSL